MVQVARRGASVLKRRKSRNRMDAPGVKSATAAAAAAASTSGGGPLATPSAGASRDGGTVGTPGGGGAGSGGGPGTSCGAAAAAATSENTTHGTPITPAPTDAHHLSKSESDGDVVFYMEEPRAAGEYKKNIYYTN